MGSGVSRHLLGCFRSSAGNLSSYPDLQPLDETLGHSFCYVRSGTLTGPAPAPDSTLPSPRSSSASASASDFSAAFKSISGASVSANSSAPLPIYDNATNAPFHPQPHFRSSSSFSAIPLQIASAAGATASGPLDRGLFLSGPIERGGGGVPLSGPLVKRNKRRGISGRYIKKKASLLQRSLSEKNRPWVVPLSRSFHAAKKCVENEENGEVEDVEWAHGKAGEDRVHVVVSESQRWLYVGIYDGFNGPEAPEFLVDNLYRAVFNELRGISWKEVEELEELEEVRIGRKLWEYLKEEEEGEGERLEFSGSGRFALSLGTKLRSGFGSWRKEEEKAKVVQEVVREKVKRRLKVVPVSDHAVVLRAMERGLEVVESAYLEMTDRAMDCNPELALMGSCLLVVLVRDEDVYVMNLGDSRAIVAQYKGKRKGENGGEVGEGEGEDGGNVDGAEIELPGWETKELVALQLSTDHSTSIEEEVFRIRQEHPDDDQCIVDGRVKGRLMVTRAFGAGYLKHPKWNDALLEMFRNEFIGTAPYVSSVPSLCHYKLGTNDQFLVLSSDGLYQYLNNEEVVSYVESFMERFPDGDPAQSLIEELLFRAAQKAGIGFTELLDIPQGDRRKYHDDVTVMVISLEGRIWKSSGKYM